MKKHALALAVVGVCGLVPQAFAHELAYSKKDNIKVEVPGDASTWCKPQVDLTISRPAWDNQELLTGLLSKLPFVFAKDCSTAGTGTGTGSGAGTCPDPGTCHGSGPGSRRTRPRAGTTGTGARRSGRTSACCARPSPCCTTRGGPSPSSGRSPQLGLWPPGGPGKPQPDAGNRRRRLQMGAEQVDHRRRRHPVVRYHPGHAVPGLRLWPRQLRQNQLESGGYLSRR